MQQRPVEHTPPRQCWSAESQSRGRGPLGVLWGVPSQATHYDFWIIRHFSEDSESDFSDLDAFLEVWKPRISDADVDVAWTLPQSFAFDRSPCSLPYADPRCRPARSGR